MTFVQLIKDNWEIQCALTEKMFFTLLPKYNNDREVVYEILERMIVKAQNNELQPTTTEHELAITLAGLVNDLLAIVRDNAPDPKKKKETKRYAILVTSLSTRYNDFCYDLIFKDNNK